MHGIPSQGSGLIFNNTSGDLLLQNKSHERTHSHQMQLERKEANRDRNCSSCSLGISGNNSILHRHSISIKKKGASQSFSTNLSLRCLGIAFHVISLSIRVSQGPNIHRTIENGSNWFFPCKEERAKEKNSNARSRHVTLSWRAFEKVSLCHFSLLTLVSAF